MTLYTLNDLPSEFLNLLYNSLPYHEKFNVVPRVSTLWRGKYLQYLTKVNRGATKDTLIRDLREWGVKLLNLRNQELVNPGFTFSSAMFQSKHVVKKLYLFNDFKTESSETFIKKTVVNTHFRIKFHDAFANNLVNQFILTTAFYNLSFITLSSLRSLSTDNSIRFFCNSYGKYCSQPLFQISFTARKILLEENSFYPCLDFSIDKKKAPSKTPSFAEFLRFAVVSTMAKHCEQILEISF